MNYRYMSVSYVIFSFKFIIVFSTHYVELSDPILETHGGNPKFSQPILNTSVPVGREAQLTCIVDGIGSYKVAWLRVDTQTILTIQNHVITKNQRVGIINSEHNTWQLTIKNIKVSDKGWYMCQINTDPMKSQMGYLDVVVPPDILDYPTSADMVVRENSNLTLKCAVTGSPEPIVTWKRENGEFIELPGGIEVQSVEGTNLIIPRVRRHHMGAYLCIASNGIPPSVSKRITIIVHFPPNITVRNQLIGAIEGKSATLECQSEAYPKSINYWTSEKGVIVPQGDKYNASLTEDNEYKVTMKLHIDSLTSSEFGLYKCIAKNSLGDTEGTVKLYKIPTNAVTSHGNRHKGKKRKGVDRYYSKHLNYKDETENQGKRRDFIREENDNDNFHSSSSVLFENKKLSTRFKAIILQIAAIVLLFC